MQKGTLIWDIARNQKWKTIMPDKGPMRKTLPGPMRKTLPGPMRETPLTFA
jgi:hypothetical protein